MKRFLLIVILLTAGCGALPSLDRLRGTGGSNPSSSKAESLRLVFLDVGQGDSTLISSSNEVMLIDAGPVNAGRNVVLPFLKQQGIMELKYIVATHYHDDHIGGIPEVIKGEDQVLGTSDDIIPTNGVLDRGGEYEGPAYEEYASTTDNIRGAVHPGDNYTVGSATVEVLAANGELMDGTKIGLEPDDENSAGIVLLLNDGDFSFLDEADLTGGGGDPPYQTIDIETSLAPLVGNVDVLKVAHHGSQTSTNEAFIEAVSPELAVISAGDGNDFGHPSEEVIDRLLDSGAEVYQTERGWLDDEYLDDVQITDGPITISVSEDDWIIE